MNVGSDATVLPDESIREIVINLGYLSLLGFYAVLTRKCVLRRCAPSKNVSVCRNVVIWNAILKKTFKFMFLRPHAIACLDQDGGCFRCWTLYIPCYCVLLALCYLVDV